MEITCNRCNQTIQSDNCYCPACGLPQLMYTADSLQVQAQQLEQGSQPARDASEVAWKPALRTVLLLAIPAGLLSSGISPLGHLGMFWMAAAASWAVVLYMRSQRPAWITIGAGARIGLVTGLLGGWMAFSASGGALFLERFLFHQSAQIDSEWKTRIGLSQQLAQQWTSGMSPADAAEAQTARDQVQSFMLSPEGHAGIETFSFVFNSFFLILFAVGGGALGARMQNRSRRPGV